jgi:hypothetical protein
MKTHKRSRPFSHPAIAVVASVFAMMPTAVASGPTVIQATDTLRMTGVKSNPPATMPSRQQTR